MQQRTTKEPAAAKTATVTRATCKACGHQFTGKYCNNCGEKIYTDHDKSFFHLIEEGVHFITHFEGTFFRTLRYIFYPAGQALDRLLLWHSQAAL